MILLYAGIELVQTPSDKLHLKYPMHSQGVLKAS